MDRITIILIVIGLAALLGKALFAGPGRTGYNILLGCMSLLSTVFLIGLIGIVMVAAKGCQ